MRFSDFHCSLGEGRSFTDPVSNWVMISGPRLDRDLVGMLMRGKYPIRYLPDFLHEVVHHWCFYSPVGATLALLRMRAIRNAFLQQKEETPEGTNFSLLEDVVRYETAITLMRPLAEGLALFAEFDAAPGDSPVLSTVSILTALGFLDLDGEPVEGDADTVAASWQRVAYLLANQRVSHDFCERKANLLVQSLTTKDGGYLPGYFTVKNLWRILSQRDERFFDTDLFLTYMRHFFYEDYAFVATILDPDAKVLANQDSAEAISVYFQKRFGDLIRLTTRDSIDQFIRAHVDGGGAGVHLTAAANPERVALGRQRRQELVDEINFDGPADTLEKQLRRSDLWFMAQRELICIGSFQAPVKINENHRVFVGELTSNDMDFRLPLFSASALEDVPPGQGEGSIEFFVSASEKYWVATVTLEGKVVAVASTSDNVTDDVRQQIAGYRISSSQILDLRKASNSLLEHILSDESSSAIMEHYRVNATYVADGAYAGRALVFVPDERLDKMLTLLKENGLYDLVGGDSEIIQALAMLSLLTSAVLSSHEALPRTLAEQWLAKEGLELATVLAAIRGFEEEHHLTLVEVDGDFLLCFL